MKSTPEYRMVSAASDTFGNPGSVTARLLDGPATGTPKDLPAEFSTYSARLSWNTGDAKAFAGVEVNQDNKGTWVALSTATDATLFRTDLWTKQLLGEAPAIPDTGNKTVDSALAALKSGDWVGLKSKQSPALGQSDCDAPAPAPSSSSALPGFSSAQVYRDILCDKQIRADIERIRTALGDGVRSNTTVASAGSDARGDKFTVTVNATKAIEDQADVINEAANAAVARAWTVVSKDSSGLTDGQSAPTKVDVRDLSKQLKGIPISAQVWLKDGRIAAARLDPLAWSEPKDRGQVLLDLTFDGTAPVLPVPKVTVTDKDLQDLLANPSGGLGLLGSLFGGGVVGTATAAGGAAGGTLDFGDGTDPLAGIDPSMLPTDLPTDFPTDLPTDFPTDLPTEVPSELAQILDDAGAPVVSVQ